MAHIYVNVGPVKPGKTIFAKLSGPWHAVTGSTWLLWNLRCCYGIYVAVTESTWLLPSLSGCYGVNVPLFCAKIALRPCHTKSGSGLRSGATAPKTAEINRSCTVSMRLFTPNPYRAEGPGRATGAVFIESLWERFDPVPDTVVSTFSQSHSSKLWQQFLWILCGGLSMGIYVLFYLLYITLIAWLSDW